MHPPCPPDEVVAAGAEEVVEVVLTLVVEVVRVVEGLVEVEEVVALLVEDCWTAVLLGLGEEPPPLQEKISGPGMV